MTPRPSRSARKPAAAARNGASTMRVLAIDPAIRNTGYAVLEGDPRKPTVLGL